MKTLDSFEKMKEHIPTKVNFIFKELEASGKKGWLVGGCVRDLLMDKIPCDWDICTTALPEEIISIFKKTVPTGIKHGTVTVIENKESYEVTTLRIDGDYIDNRRPDSVVFTEAIESDLARRDFTMNSIAIDMDGVITDPFGGIHDISIGLIKSVGNADTRFKEDSLRMLRAIRFKAQLDFEIDKDTEESIRTNAKLIKNISSERIKIEIEKTITSKNPGLIFTFNDYGLLEQIMPELLPSITTYQTNTFHEQTVAVHTARALKASDSSPLIRWAVLFHDIGKPNVMTVGDDGVTHFYGHEKESAILAERIMKRLKFPRDFMEKIVKLILVHDLRIEPSEKSVRKAICRISEELFPFFIEIKKADISGQHTRYYDRFKRIPEIESILESVREKNECYSLKDLNIDGNDLLKLGIKPGPHVGKMLGLLLDIVIDDPALNKKEILIEKVKEIKMRP